MSTIVASAPRAPAVTARFHVRMALAFVAIAFLGFSPSYWAPIAAGTLQAPPIMHIHGALLFAWTLFYLAQTLWVGTGHTSSHRSWGMAGIALFTLMICSILLLKLTVIRLDDARGMGEASRRFAAIALCNLPLMIGLFALAIANVQRPQVHKRLMVSLMAGLMIPAIARVFLALFAPPGAAAGGPPPPFVALPPTLVALLLILVAMLHDWRTERRRHPVYVYAGLAMVLSNVFAVLVAGTDGWLATVRAFERLAG
jgi:hypothetical protein